MPVVDDVTKSLMGQAQQPRGARDTSVCLIKRALDEFTFPLVYFVLKRACDRRALRSAGGSIRGN